MDDYRQQQIEALAMVSDYMDKLIPAIEEVSAELMGEMKEDTVSYLDQIIDAFNFVIETFNVTRDIANENNALIVEAELDKEIKSLSGSLKIKDYRRVGQILSGSILDFLKVYNLKAKELVG